MLQELKTRKLKTRELFRLSMDIYGKNFKYICLICLAVYVPLYTIFSLIPFDHYIDTNAILAGDMNKFLGFLYFVSAVCIIFTPLAVAAFTYIGKQAVAEGEITVAGILDASLMKWPKLIVTALFFIVIISISSILIVPMLYFGISLGFYGNVVAITDKWGFSAIAESRRVVKGRWWATLFFMILISIFTFIITAATDLSPLTSEGNLNIILNIVGSTFSQIVTSYFQIIVVMYFLNVYYLEPNGVA